MDVAGAHQHPSFDRLANYRIVVHGKLALCLSDRLEGLTIEHATAEDETPLSVLAGELANQAALASALQVLYEFRRAIACVEQLPLASDRSLPASES